MVFVYISPRREFEQQLGNWKGNERGKNGTEEGGGVGMRARNRRWKKVCGSKWGSGVEDGSGQKPLPFENKT